MKVILDIPDNKAASIMDVLKSISFLKIETISQSKAQFLKEFESSVEEVNSAKQGKIKLRTVDELIDELLY